MNVTRALSVAATLVLLVMGAQSATPRQPAAAAMTVSAQVTPSDTVKSDARRALDETRKADEALAELASNYRYLDGVTVSVGTTPNGEQAVAFYTQGRILISSTHSFGVKTILQHEIWHIIDWRDNGRLDWGEDVPPDDFAAYLK